jgi:hypothetical protein
MIRLAWNKEACNFPIFICKQTHVRFLALLIVCSLPTMVIAQPPGVRCFKAVSGDNPVWPVGNVLCLSAPGESDSINLSGFTRQNATVYGILNGTGLHIPRQTVTIEPKGFPGVHSFEAIAEAEGVLNDTLLQLSFSYQPQSHPIQRGTITAIPWNRAEMWASAPNEAPAQRDTMLYGKRYDWVLYDQKGMVVEIGERYDNHVKNGRWWYTDDEGRWDNIHHYVNDTLHGFTTSYFYKQDYRTLRFMCLQFPIRKQLVSRQRGLYLKGKKVGRWTHQWAYQRKRQALEWTTEAYYNYDNDGRLLSKILTYDNDWPVLEIFYAPSGEMTWYCRYDESGNVVDEGARFSEVSLLEGGR